MPDQLLVDALGGLIRIDRGDLSDDTWCRAERAWRSAAAAPDRRGPDATVTASAVGTAEATLGSLSQRVTHAAIGIQRHAQWMLHAAGVAGPDGGVVVLVGPSGRGKTTAALTLGRTLGYVSDETVGIHADGTITAYRKPLSILTSPITRAKTQIDATELGLQPLPDAPLRLAALILLERSPDVTEPFLERISFGDAAADLVSQTSFLTSIVHPLRRMGATAEAIGGIRRLHYREIEDAIGLLTDLAHTRSIIDSRVTRVDAAPPRCSDASPDMSLSSADPLAQGPLVRQGAMLDSWDDLESGRLLVLQAQPDEDGSLITLDGIGPTLWRTAGEGASLDQLSAATVAAHGAPVGTEPHEAVRHAVDTLRASGVLVEVQTRAHPHDRATARDQDVTRIDGRDDEGLPAR